MMYDVVLLSVLIRLLSIDVYANDRYLVRDVAEAELLASLDRERLRSRWCWRGTCGCLASEAPSLRALRLTATS
jgi:hypothetical protein